ncbi:uncharacterized protein LOC119558648 isoform X2 [Drosophila subpulchrella]|uniref:uncharacterized protein LOC119558648 isoform X2 n=1 Tax=Drosophila subpulchrella TaxID=1486046 RepID=UPI0018A158E9|nr:uncharacterized protein LOC119558648 isoform X2 [Drosophila subpulchrella]
MDGKPQNRLQEEAIPQQRGTCQCDFAPYMDILPGMSSQVLAKTIWTPYTTATSYLAA